MLNPEKALELARRLTVVADFPTYTEAIEATAEDLVVLTEDSPNADVAEARARWLVNEIRFNWRRWSGTVDLIALYRMRFVPPRELKSEDNEAKNYGAKPPIVCKLCNDTGVRRVSDYESKPATARYEWCECETGILLHFDLPDWLEIVNGTLSPRVFRLPPLDFLGVQHEFAKHPAAEKTVSEEIEKTITLNPECPACTVQTVHTHRKFWQYHCRQENPIT